MPKTIYLGSDHGGFELKKKLSVYIKRYSLKIIDYGPFQLDRLDDHPDYAYPVAQKVAADKNSLGILICRNGIGIGIAANKIKGIRAGLCTYPGQAITARKDDDCNILVLAADFTTFAQAKKIFDNFIRTPFSTNPKYSRRVKKIAQIEAKIFRNKIITKE